MDRTPQLGDLVEIKPMLPVLAKVIKKEQKGETTWITLLWPSGTTSAHEIQKFQTVVTADRLADTYWWGPFR